MTIALEKPAFFCSDGTSAELQTASEDNVFRLEYSFQGTGYAGMVFSCATDLPENYVLEFDIRGAGRPQTLECKLVNESGTTVWWAITPGYTAAADWTAVRLKKRRFRLAWGPSAAPLKSIGRVEIVLTAGEGGAGFVEVRNPGLRAVPPVSSRPTAAAAAASSGRDSAKWLCSSEGAGGSWHSDESEEQQLEISFAGTVELGGLVINWGERHARAFDVALKDPEQGWTVVDRISGFEGGASFHYLPDCEANALRLVLREHGGGAGPGRYEIKRITIQDIDFSFSWNTFLSRRAQAARPGLYPRYLLGEQSYWTVVAANGSAQKALINEEGMVELGYALPSLEPFIRSGPSLLTWSDGRAQQKLIKGHLPVPVVERLYENFLLKITAWMDARSSSEVLYIDYELFNTSSARQTGCFYAAIRPYQVNPPWQCLNCSGGFCPINAIEVIDEDTRQSARIDGINRLMNLNARTRFGAFGYWQGDIAEILERGRFRETGKAEDARGYCSAAFEFPFDLAPDERANFSFACPYNGRLEVKDPRESLAETIGYWENLLAKAQFSIAAAPELQDTVRAQLGYALVNRSGPALQPGTRCYRRTWIRDGALTSSALLQFGFVEEVGDFVRWFAPYVPEDGNVPCVVDRRGADPTPEHDSHGEFLYLAAEYFRYSGDANLLKEMLPKMMRAAGRIQRLCQETTGAGIPPEARGLLPKSISHEGYSSCPAYSYWDDLWAVKGLVSAAEAAHAIGAPAEAKECEELGHSLAVRVCASIRLSMARHGTSYIPGAADLGDFDATSTTIGADPCGLLLSAMRAELETTFAEYWRLFTERKGAFNGGKNYTPYELRTIGTLVRLGKDAEAREALEFFMTHRRPSGWRHWAEVVWADARSPKFIGDAPHGWIGSDFLRAVRSMLLYELEGRWIIGEGIPLDWWRSGVSCAVHTPSGPITIRSGEEDGKITVEIEGPASLACLLHIPSGARGFGGRPVDADYARIQLPARGEFL